MGKTITDRGRKRGPVDPKPKRRPANGKPVRVPPKAKPKKLNIHQLAKATGVDGTLPDAPKPEIEFRIDPDLMEALEGATGRPTVLTSELGSRVCSLIAQRHSLKQIEEMGDGLPCEGTVYRWLAADPQDPAKKRLYDAFREAFARARQLRAHTRTEAIHNYERLLTDRSLPQAERLDAATARVAMELQRVLMEVENPNAYSKRVAVQGGGKNAPPIEHRALTQLSREELEAIARGGLEESED